MLTDQVGHVLARLLPAGRRHRRRDRGLVAFVQISMALSEGTNLFGGRVRVDLKNPQ